MAIVSTVDLRLDTSYKQILKLALPISAALFVPQINFITNTIFLSGLGERELGLAGLTGVYYLIFGSVGFGLNNGLQALIARRSGENRIGDIGKIFSQGVFVALSIALIAIAFTYLFLPYVFRSTIHSTESYEMAVDFLRIRIWGLPFLYLYQMRNALLVGTNNSKLLITGTIAETLANIFFDYGLIYGKLGMPALGFNGAAIASIIAEFTGMFVVFLVIRRRGLHRTFQLFEHFGLDKTISKLILVQSSPLILQHALSIISWEFFYILIEHHGARELAISNTMRTIFSFAGVFSWAFAATSNTMVSNIIGQGKKELVIPLINRIVLTGLCFAVPLGLLLNIFPGLFLSIFGQGPSFLEEALPVVRVVSVALVLMSFASVWLYSVTATGNTLINLGIEAIAVIVYVVYAWFTLEYLELSIAWGWASEWIYWVLMFGMSFLYLRSGRWKKKVI